jgi:hypothetical protein
MKNWVGQACPTQSVGVFGRDPNAEVADEELGETTTAGQKCCRVGLPVLLLMSFATCTPKMPLVAWNFKCGKNRHFKSKSDASLINREDLAKAMGAMMVEWDNHEIHEAPIKNQALLRFYLRRALWEIQHSAEEIADENTKDKRNVLCDNLDELRIRMYEPKLAHAAVIAIAADLDARQSFSWSRQRTWTTRDQSGASHHADRSCRSTRRYHRSAGHHNHKSERPPCPEPAPAIAGPSCKSHSTECGPGCDY